ncbi:MAG: alpha/beta hydrolase [Planctomycetota bacterium]
MSRRRAVVLSVLGATVLGAVVTAAARGPALLNLLSSNGVYELERDVRYRAGPRGTLDVYRPARAEGPAPLIVFFYGGGWKDGTKDDYEFVASSFAREGYVVVVPDYRLYPDVVFPAFAEDAAAAVAWVQAEAERLGGDPARLVLMGHSAGAHLAALVALDAELLRGAGGDPDRIAAFVGLAGPYDFLPFDPGSDLEQIFPEGTRAASQPVLRVEGAERVPPTLLIHGTADEVVIPRNTRRLAEALVRRGAPAEVRYMEGVGHVRLAAALAPPLRFVAGTRGAVLEWLLGVVGPVDDGL